MYTVDSLDRFEYSCSTASLLSMLLSQFSAFYNGLNHGFQFTMFGFLYFLKLSFTVDHKIKKILSFNLPYLGNFNYFIYNLVIQILYSKK